MDGTTATTAVIAATRMRRSLEVMLKPTLLLLLLIRVTCLLLIRVTCLLLIRVRRCRRWASERRREG